MNARELREYYNSTKCSQPWTKETVFKVYCNDDLNKLPLKILKQMRSYLDNIIDNKEEIN